MATPILPSSGSVEGFGAPIEDSSIRNKIAAMMNKADHFATRPSPQSGGREYCDFAEDFVKDYQGLMSSGVSPSAIAKAIKEHCKGAPGKAEYFLDLLKTGLFLKRETTLLHGAAAGTADTKPLTSKGTSIEHGPETKVKAAGVTEVGTPILGTTEGATTPSPAIPSTSISGPPGGAPFPPTPAELLRAGNKGTKGFRDAYHEGAIQAGLTILETTINGVKATLETAKAPKEEIAKAIGGLRSQFSPSDFVRHYCLGLFQGKTTVNRSFLIRESASVPHTPETNSYVITFTKEGASPKLTQKDLEHLLIRQNVKTGEWSAVLKGETLKFPSIESLQQHYLRGAVPLNVDEGAIAKVTNLYMRFVQSSAP